MEYYLQPHRPPRANDPVFVNIIWNMREAQCSLQLFEQGAKEGIPIEIWQISQRALYML